MRAIVGLLVLAFALCARAAPPRETYQGADPTLLQQVQDQFAAATGSGKATQELIQRLEKSLPADSTQWPPVFLAYRAALEGLAGKHSLRPWTKYNRAKASLAKFKGLAEAYPDSIEIRMLRYSTCSQLPDFFKMRPQANADLAVLVELFERGADPLIPEKLRQGYIQWILDKSQPAPEIRQRLETALSRSTAP
jgi:hypothetical protein